MNNSKKVLIIVTNSDGEGIIKNTGVWLEEFAVPYLVFCATNYEVTVASPLGGVAPIDIRSMSCSNPMEWDECIKILRDTRKLPDIDYENFDVLFLPGGHGPMFDLAKDLNLKKIVEYFYNSNKVISAVCHGPAGLVLAKDKEGVSILNDKKVTCFTNREEKIIKMEEFVPFSLENQLRALGAVFVEEKPWSEHVIVDNNIITGQNPGSSLLLAELVIKCLENK